MANALANVTALRPAKPVLPGYLAAILDREAAPDIGWQAPSEAWVAQREPALRTALDALKAALAPADEGFVREKLAVLGAYKGAPAGVAAEWKLRGHEYVRLLGHNPPDIWEDALDEWTLGSRWFPDTSDLNAIMHPRLMERRLRVERLEAMLRQMTKRQPAACAVWREKESAIKDAIGDDAFDVYLGTATPHEDDGTCLVLAVPNKQIGLSIRQKFGPILERLLQREVKVIVASWAGHAASARQAGQDTGARA